ncbi:MAG: serine/threonine protein kinase [Polyangiaceae bacterium]|nr:serine/threonine protein kinase [Polyangiaceae bacterium]
MGVVLAAIHLDLRQPVALKVMHAALTESGENLQRFLREARIAATLRSPHVGRVLDVGRLEDGTPFIVMERLEGTDLEALLQQRGPMPLATAVGYLLQVCEAVAEAHAVGVVHRDLKPGNLFLTQDAYGEVCIRVLDFGVSKLAQPSGRRMDLTRANTLMGSPLYMSPEQAVSSRDVDHRTDIWSLGAILYELVTGTSAWYGTTLAEVFVRISSAPTPLARERVPGLPVLVDNVIGRCLEKSPAARFQSVVELADALRTLPGGDPSRIDRIRRLATRNTRVSGTFDLESGAVPGAVAQARAQLVESIPVAAPPFEPGSAIEGGYPARSAVGVVTVPDGGSVILPGNSESRQQARAGWRWAAACGLLVVVGFLGGLLWFRSAARTTTAKGSDSAGAVTTPPAVTTATVSAAREPAAPSAAGAVAVVVVEAAPSAEAAIAPAARPGGGGPRPQTVRPAPPPSAPSLRPKRPASATPSGAWPRTPAALPSSPGSDLGGRF